MSVPETAVARPRGALRLLVDPTFGGLFWGRVLSSAGVWMHSVAAAIVVYEHTRSALLVGMVSVVQFAPQVFLAPWSGARADVGDPARQIMLGRLLCAAGSGGLAMWLVLLGEGGAGSAGAAAVTWAVLTTSLVVGLGFVVGGPAMQSIVPTLLRPGELGLAMALNSVPMITARIAGPALGAVAAAEHGAASSFLIAAVTHLAFALVLLVVRYPAVLPPEAGVDYSVRFSLAHVRGDRSLLLLLVLVTAVGFGSEPTATLAPALAERAGGGAALVGGLTACFGVGAAVGLVAAGVLGRVASLASLSTGGIAILGLGLLVAPLGDGRAGAVTGFGLVGVGFSLTLTAATTLVQERTPPELRGRVMAIWLVGLVGSRPLAGAVVGVLADAWSLTAAFVAVAALMLALLVPCRPGRLVSPVVSAPSGVERGSRSRSVGPS